MVNLLRAESALEADRIGFPILLITVMILIHMSGRTLGLMRSHKCQTMLPMTIAIEA